MSRRIGKDQPLGAILRAERLVVAEGAPDAIVIEDHPQAGLRLAQDRRHVAQCVIGGIGIAAGVVGKEVHMRLTLN